MQAARLGGPSCRATNTRPRGGFTLVEAMVALLIMAVASSALMLSSTTALTTAAATQHGAVAYGMAEQLVDEVAGKRRLDPSLGNPASPLGPEAGEANVRNTREAFDDIDDFAGYTSQPPVDMYGEPLGADCGKPNETQPRRADLRAPGGLFDRWRQEVDVYCVDPADLGRAIASGTSPYRAVEVRIVQLDAQGARQILAQLRRVFYVE